MPSSNWSYGLRYCVTFKMWMWQNDREPTALLGYYAIEIAVTTLQINIIFFVTLQWRQSLDFNVAKLECSCIRLSRYWCLNRLLLVIGYYFVHFLNNPLCWNLTHKCIQSLWALGRQWDIGDYVISRREDIYHYISAWIDAIVHRKLSVHKIKNWEFIEFKKCHVINPSHYTLVGISE